MSITCYFCDENSKSCIMTWFIQNDSLLKKPVCRSCIDSKDIDFNRLDMYTGDEIIKFLEPIRSDLLKEKIISTEAASKIKIRLSKVLKPTLEEKEIKLNR